ncbi:VWA domain-containing protein [Veillonella sp. CNR 79/14]|uniref:VWA domain-containing protein n=1 Tax=Veillonella sp. CNR 79/14 TaxID=2490954 RepID=UPI000F8E5359|nr:VWA domain-containing protein [Veillonella sp. CNR 79/14]
MSVQLNTGIHLFLQEPLLRTLLISGEVGTGKTYALLQALLDRGRTYTTITSHTDVSAMQEAVDIQRTLETAQIVKQAHPWDVYDLLICEGLDHFDRSMWLRILYEQNRRYEEGRPLQIIGTYTGAEGLSEWVYDMDLWIPIESPDVDTRVRVLADRDHADIYENGATRECYHGEGISVDVYGTHGEELICSKGKLMDAPGIPTVHDSIYTYISSLVEKFNISFMGMEYILLKAAIGLAREKGHQFVEPTDVESVLQWTLPQKMKNLVNPRTQQDGEAQDSSDRMPSNEARREQEERKGTSSNRGEENSSPQKAGNGQLQDGQEERSPQGMRSDGDRSYEMQKEVEEDINQDTNQAEKENGSGYMELDGPLGNDTDKEGLSTSHRDKVEESFALSEAVETQVLHLYGMLQSGLAKKHIDISDDGRGPKVHRQGTMGRTIAWIPTIVQGIVRSRKVPIRLTIEDIRYAMYQEIPKEAIYLVVDTSGSMGQRQRLQGAEKLLSQLVQMMYVKRQYVSLITFQKHGAQCVVPLTQRIETIPKALGEARIGGRTPFVKGIEEAVKQIGNDMSQMGHVQAKVVIITDGKVTSQALQGLDDIGRWLANQGIQTTVIDTDTSFVRMNRAKEIAHMLGAELIDINQYIVI